MLKNICKSICWIALYFIASIIGMAIVSTIYILFVPGYTMLTEMEMMYKTAVPGLIVAAIICITIFIVYKVVRKHEFDITTIKPDRVIFSMGVGMFANCVITFLVAIVIQFMPEQVVTSLQESTDVVSNTESQSILILLLGTGILVPIMEEIVFRHGLFSTLSRSNKIVAYIVSALVFGIAHGNLIQGIYATILGLIFAFFLDRGENIWYAMIMHASINSTSVLLEFAPDYAALVLLGFGAIGLSIVAVTLCTSKNVRDMFICCPKDYTIHIKN